ncbi:MAG: AraC family transcriptional regulator [Bacteroidales bacterium]|nr:AraC family transcriptional regulator [Bacteroidales bacterium]
MKENANIKILNVDLTNPKTYHIGQDVILIDGIEEKNFPEYPFSMDFMVVTLVKQGTVNGNVNMRPFSSNGQGMILILQDLLVETISLSDDFEGRFMLYSKKFLESLNLTHWNLKSNILNNLFYPMNDELFSALSLYFDMIKGVLEREENPNREEIVCLLTKAYFLGAGYYLHSEENVVNDRNNEITEKFMELVRRNCNEHRDLDFYASELCLTSKYMSETVREVTGLSAQKWIEKYVVMNAKAMLSSTNLTISEICDRLNFLSLADFGKYFKRTTGLSPRAYRDSLS